MATANTNLAARNDARQSMKALLQFAGRATNQTRTPDEQAEARAAFDYTLEDLRDQLAALEKTVLGA